MHIGHFPGSSMVTIEASEPHPGTVRSSSRIKQAKVVLHDFCTVHQVAWSSKVKTVRLSARAGLAVMPSGVIDALSEAAYSSGRKWLLPA